MILLKVHTMVFFLNLIWLYVKIMLSCLTWITRPFILHIVLPSEEWRNSMLSVNFYYDINPTKWFNFYLSNFSNHTSLTTDGRIKIKIYNFDNQLYSSGHLNMSHNYFDFPVICLTQSTSIHSHTNIKKSNSIFTIIYVTKGYKLIFEQVYVSPKSNEIF